VSKPPVTSQRTQTVEEDKSGRKGRRGKKRCLEEDTDLLLEEDKSGHQGRRGKKRCSEEDKEEANKPTIKRTSTAVIDCSSPRRKYPRESFIIGSKYTLQVADVLFKAKGGGTTGYEALVIRREGTINDSTGKTTKPFEFSIPSSCIQAVHKVTGIMLARSEEAE
jgi:hypothetical protein